jgi:uncharacterized membrane protein
MFSSKVVERLITRIFVDGVWLHRVWPCHRLSGRSFFLGARQFHICARCTGLALGIPGAVCVLPAGMNSLIIFGLFFSALLLDSLTQLAGFRESNNAIRFITGAGTSATFVSSLILLLLSYVG